MKVPAGEKSSSRYIQESSDYAVPVQRGGGSFDGTVLYNHWRRDSPMLDVPQQSCMCASSARKGESAYGWSEESARAAIAERGFVRERGMGAACLGQSMRNQDSHNKWLATSPRVQKKKSDRQICRCK